MERVAVQKALGFEYCADPGFKLGEVPTRTEGDSTQWECTGVVNWFYMLVTYIYIYMVLYTTRGIYLSGLEEKTI